MTKRRNSRFDVLLYEIRDGTAWIRLNRPEVLNAFSTQLYRELRDAVRLADADRGVDTIVITGTGRAFGTGGDLEEGLQVLSENADPLDVYRFADNLPYDTIRDCPKVVIAAVNGVCMAGGLIAALSSDIIVAAESATFGIPEGKIGMPEPWVPNLLFGRVSIAQLKYLALTGGTIGAKEARELGLVPLVVPDDELEPSVRTVIDRVRQTTPEARTRYKEYIDRLIPRVPAIEAARVMRTPGALERLQAYATERRKKR